MEGAGRRQLEGKGRLAGAGDWLLATALRMLSRWSRGITFVPAPGDEANLGSRAVAQGMLTVPHNMSSYYPWGVTGPCVRASTEMEPAGLPSLAMLTYREGR